MYYKIIISPQLADTNAARHIDHTAIIDWFDRARVYMYREMDPTLTFRPHGLAVLTTTVYYQAPATALADVEVRTWVTKLGRKSMEVCQDLWQDGKCRAKTKTVVCGFNVDTRTSEPIVDSFRAITEKYFWDEYFE